MFLGAIMHTGFIRVFTVLSMRTQPESPDREGLSLQKESR